MCYIDKNASPSDRGGNGDMLNFVPRPSAGVTTFNLSPSYLSRSVPRGSRILFNTLRSRQAFLMKLTQLIECTGGQSVEPRDFRMLEGFEDKRRVDILLFKSHEILFQDRIPTFVVQNFAPSALLFARLKILYPQTSVAGLRAVPGHSTHARSGGRLAH